MVQRVQLDNYVPGSQPEGKQAKVGRGRRVYN